MNKEQQDNLWNDLSEETKKEYREKYKSNLADSKKYLMGDVLDKSIMRSEIIVKELETMFGVHNLNPQLQIKTWEDVARLHPEIDTDLNEGIQELCNHYKNCGIQYIIKCHATLKIQKLIELGYGGIVSRKEWENDKTNKYCVEINNNELEYTHYTTTYCFIAFHTLKQREEFMSHKSNRKLVKQYYMI